MRGQEDEEPEVALVVPVATVPVATPLEPDCEVTDAAGELAMAEEPDTMVENPVGNVVVSVTGMTLVETRARSR